MLDFILHGRFDQQRTQSDCQTEDKSVTSQLQSVRITHGGYNSTSSSKRRKYTTFEWIYVCISIFHNFSAAVAKPRVTRSDYSSKYNDFSIYSKRPRRFQENDHMDTTIRQPHSKEIDEYSLDSSSDGSDYDHEYNYIKSKSCLDLPHVDVTSSVRRYQNLNDEIFHGDNKNRSFASKYTDINLGRKLNHQQQYGDDSNLGQGTPDLFVDNRQVQRLLRLSCSLSLCHETVSSYVKTDVKDTIPGTSVSTYIDTGASHTVMTYSAAKRAGIAHLIDSRYAGQASGVAGISCTVLGRIPSNTVSFIFQIGDGKSISLEQSPVIMVLEDNFNQHGSEENVDMLIGLDLLEEWQATICLRSRDLCVRRRKKSRYHQPSDEEIIIPFYNTHYENQNKENSHDDVESPSLPHNIVNDLDHKLYESRYARSTVLQTRGGKVRNSHSENMEDSVNDLYEDYSDEDENYDGCDMSGV